MEFLDYNAFLYFFSALAQCAAAFAALVGVFLIFRLQANSSTIEETYLHARIWLRTSHEFPKQTVKEELKRSLQKNKDNQLVKDYLSKIERAEGFGRKLALEASLPLKFWGLIFFISIGVLPFIKIFLCISVMVYVLLLLWVAWALLLTRKFLQNCLA